MADELPAGVVVVSRMPAPGGGEWILGSDGGVFAVGGAQFLGAYTTVAGPQRTDRKWDSITASGAGGYILTDKEGFKYQFDPKAPEIKAPDAPVAAPQASLTPEKPSTASGEAIVKAALDKYGLASLGTDLLAYLRSAESGGSEDAVFLKMREDPRYKTRFAGMELRAKAGYDPMSEEEYIQWEGQTKALFDHYGIPKDFYDTPEELATFIGGNVSPLELKSRIEKGYNDVFSSPPETLTALQNMYGVDSAHMAAFFLDPTKGEEVIQKRWVASQISGQAIKAGFDAGGLTAKEAEALGTSGMSGKEAQGAFGTLVQSSQLTAGMTREEQLAAAGGDVAAQQRITTEATKKKAAFGSGGDFAAGKEGVSGLGTSNS